MEERKAAVFANNPGTESRKAVVFANTSGIKGREAEQRSAEERAAGDFAVIIKFLELNNDMERYLSLYRLLTTMPLDGLKLSKALQAACQAEGVSITPERMQILSGYGDYTFMLRKWKSFLRQEKRKTKAAILPTWKEVMTVTLSFGTPLWESLCKGELYVADWLPEIGRFL